MEFQGVDLRYGGVEVLRGLDWTVRDRVVAIAAPERLRGGMEVRLYDVKDLASTICCFPGEDSHGGDYTGEWCGECGDD